jgi:hypothetical protein
MRFGFGLGFGGIGFVPPSVDLTAPTPVSAAISADGQMLTITLSETLDVQSVSAASAVSLSGTAAVPVGLGLVGNTIQCPLAPAVHDAQTVTVAYTQPGSNKLRDAAGNNVASFSGLAVTNGSTNTTPLGDSFWTLYVDARDYESALSNGDVLTTPLTPRVGAGVITPVNAPSVSTGVLGIGNRLAFKTVVADKSCFSANWAASAMSGVKKPGTFGVRFRRTTAANAFVMGFGRAASAVASFYEIYEGAVGQANIQKNDGTTTLSRIGSTVIGAAVADVFFTISQDGNTGKLYVNGVQEGADLDLSSMTASIVIDQLRLGNTGRSTPGGQNLGGWSQVYAFSTQTATAAQIMTIHNALVAGDVATPAGGQVYFVGDSLTVADGMRKAVYDYYTTHAPTLNIDMVGSFSSGAFGPDNQHSGVNGVEIAGVQSRAVSELGTGSPFPNVKLVHVLAGVNDLNNAGANVSTILTAYGNMLTAIYNEIVATQSTARIAVTTIMPLQPGSAGETEVVSFNAGLPAVWDAFDAAHPSNTLLRWDLYNAIGGAWASGNYLDSTHPNATGWATACAHPTYGLLAAVGPYLNSIG